MPNYWLMKSEPGDAQCYLFDELGVADIALVSPFINAAYAGYEVDAGRWPVFTAFIERVKTHEIVAPLLQAEASMLGLS